MQPVMKKFPDFDRRDLYVIIPAAGTGSRMGLSDSKQFLEIAGIPVLARTLLAFRNFEAKQPIKLHAVVVTSYENIDRVWDLVEQYDIAFVEDVVEGGDTRQDSVAAGIDALSTLMRVPAPSDIVFIHDGARCMVDFETLRACFTGGMFYKVCVAATPCKNTIKMAAAPENTANAKMPHVSKTLDRSLLYEVQTPQVFKYGVLVEVFTRAYESGITGTDDTSLAEALGIPVNLVPCSYGNIKITTPEDAALAEFLLKSGK